MNIYLMKKPKRINSFSVTMFLMAVVLGYTGWFFIPAWFSVFQLTGMMRGLCNDMYRVQDDEVLLKKLLQDSRRTKLRLTADNFRVIRHPYSDQELRDLAKTDYMRETLVKRGKSCEVQFRHTGQYTWPLINTPQEITWERSVSSSLEQITWEKKQCTCVTARDSGPPIPGPIGLSTD